MTDGLTFRRINSGNGHRYEFGLWHTTDGPGRKGRKWLREQKIPGVTTILNAGLPKSGLINWAAGTVADYVIDRLQLVEGRNGPPHVVADELVRDLREGAKYPIPAKGLPRTKLASELRYVHNRDRDEGANRGGKVHELALELATTGEADIPDPLLGYVDAYLDWRQRWRPSDELVERPVLNRSVFYAGTFDHWSIVIDDERCCRVCRDPLCPGRVLIDWKTGRSGIFGEVALQLAPYRHAEVYIDADGHEQPMVGVDHCLGVWLRPDRSHETYEIRAGADEFRLFRYAYELAKFLDGPALFGQDGDAPVRLVKSEPLLPLEVAAS